MPVAGAKQVPAILARVRINQGRLEEGLIMKHLLAFACALAVATPAAAQLEPYKDYEVSDAVMNVATVKVKENMIEDYLQGIRQTWVNSNEIARKMGHLASYDVYVSDLPSSGEFNVLLVARFANTSDLAPNKARYEAFMKAWGKENEAANRATSTTVYPNIREITGEYLMRQVKFLPAAK